MTPLIAASTYDAMTGQRFTSEPEIHDGRYEAVYWEEFRRGRDGVYNIRSREYWTIERRAGH